MSAFRLAMVALVTVPGCVYWPSVNEPPRAEIRWVGSDQAPVVTDTLVFFATKSRDSDSDPQLLTAHWRALHCSDHEMTNCPRTEADEQTLSIFEPFEVTVRSNRPIIVELTVSDFEGATNQVREIVRVRNQEPTVVVQDDRLYRFGDSYPVGVPIGLAAEVADQDGDVGAVTLDWTLVAPIGSTAAEFGPTGLDSGYRLRPDVPGRYRVELVATDADGAVSVPASVDIDVAADAPPCVAVTLPKAEDDVVYRRSPADGPVRFEVLSVTDDLDRFPVSSAAPELIGAATFQWHVATPETADAFVEVTGHGDSNHVVDIAAFGPGQRVRVRVAVADRVAREAPACTDDAAVCPEACAQRITWEVEIR